VNPGGGVDQDHGHLAFATLLQEFLDAHQILAGSRVLGELGHALAAVEFLDGSDDCFAFRLCLGESNSVCKVAIGNIDSGFHDSILQIEIFPVNVDGNTADCVCGLIKLARVIPEREAWLYENKEAVASVRRGLNQAASGKFAKGEITIIAITPHPRGG
jgi:hypothetical protein